MNPLFVCCRVGDPYYVPCAGSKKKPCCNCAHICHVDTWDLQERLGAPVMCLICWLERRHPQDQITQLPSCRKPFSAADN